MEIYHVSLIMRVTNFFEAFLWFIYLRLIYCLCPTGALPSSLQIFNSSVTAVCYMQAW